MVGWMFFLYQQLDIDAVKDVQNPTTPTAKTIFGAAAITTIISGIIYGKFWIQRFPNTELNENSQFPIFSSTNAIVVWHLSDFAGHLLDAGANIQYAPSNGAFPNMVLVGGHRAAGSLLLPSILSNGTVGGIAGIRIHHSEGEKGETRSILQLGAELRCFGGVSHAAAGRQRLEQFHTIVICGRMRRTLGYH